MSNARLPVEQRPSFNAHRPSVESIEASEEMDYEPTPVSDTPTAVRPPGIRGPTESDLPFKQLLDAISRRHIYYAQKDKEKRLIEQMEIRLRSEAARPEFASVNQLCTTSIASSTSKIRKYNDKLEAIDKTVKSSLVAVLESLVQRSLGSQEKPQDAALQKRVDELEARLAKLEEPKKDETPATRSSHYDLQAEEIKTRLFEESSKITNLEGQYQNLSDKLDLNNGKYAFADATAQEMAKLNQMISSVKDSCEDMSTTLMDKMLLQEQGVGAMSERLAEVMLTTVNKEEVSAVLGKVESIRAELAAEVALAREAMPSKMEKEAHLVEAAQVVEDRLAGFKAEIPSLRDLDQVRREMADLKVDVGSQVAAVKGTSLAASNASTQEGTLEAANDRLQQLKVELVKLQQETQQAIEAAVEAESRKLKSRFEQMLTNIMETIGKLIDSGRAEREQLAMRLNEAEVALTILRDQMSQTPSEETKLKIEALAKQQFTDRETLRDAVGKLDGSVKQVRVEAKKASEELGMQLQCLNAWQAQFSTKDLYKDIIAHITETMPGGIDRQMRMMTARLNELEKALRSDLEVPLKKENVRPR